MRHPEKHLSLPPLQKTTAAEKLIWFYIATVGENEYSTRKLGETLDIHYTTVDAAFKTLKSHGLLLETAPSSGPRPARLKALEPSG
jgi:biotin operon repressor